jgi:hypothetical protein
MTRHGANIQVRNLGLNCNDILKSFLATLPHKPIKGFTSLFAVRIGAGDDRPLVPFLDLVCLIIIRNRRLENPLH